ncbi:hypothetical protein Ac2012v2_001559 [Leucoagaricus gongylophorus]
MNSDKYREKNRIDHVKSWAILRTPRRYLASTSFIQSHIIKLPVGCRFSQAFSFSCKGSMTSEISTLTTNLARPKTSATLTVRVIKSFKFRTEKNLVVHNINLEIATVGQLKEIARQGTKLTSKKGVDSNIILSLFSCANSTGLEAIPERVVWLVFYTLKLYIRAHGAKTSNLIINLDHDDWILDDDNRILAELGFENETEVSFFNRQLYEQFKLNPQTSWD